MSKRGFLELRGMIDVDRQNSNTLHATVLCLGADNLQLTQSLDRSEEEVAQLEARRHEFWDQLEPNQFPRDEGHSSQELEWMRMEENQLASAATGCGEMCIDDTTFIGTVEPSSFVAAGDRLLVHLLSPCCTACSGDTRAAAKSSNIPVEQPEQVERETTSQKRGSWKTSV